MSVTEQAIAVVDAAQALIDGAQEVIDAAMVPSLNKDAAQSLIDEAQKIIAAEAAPEESEAPPPVLPMIADPVPLEVELPNVVEVEFSRPVSLWVHGDERRYPAGKMSITSGELATIKQTRFADAICG